MTIYLVLQINLLVYQHYTFYLQHIAHCHIGLLQPTGYHQNLKETETFLTSRGKVLISCTLLNYEVSHALF